MIIDVIGQKLKSLEARIKALEDIINAETSANTPMRWTFDEESGIYIPTE